MHYFISELITLIGLSAALVVGRNAWGGRKKALFPKLVAAGLGCMTLICVHSIIYHLVMGELAVRMYFAHLGSIGLFLFILSASYGQLDGVFDDRSVDNRKYRVLALAAPLAIMLIFVITQLFRGVGFVQTLPAFLFRLPVMMASYYNLKHAIIPDGGFTFVRSVRPYNITALAFEFTESIFSAMCTLEIGAGIIITSVIFAAGSVALMYFAGKGAEKWTL